MTDSKKDEPQGSAGGGRKGLVYALAFHGMGKGELQPELYPNLNPTQTLILTLTLHQP